MLVLWTSTLKASRLATGRHGISGCPWLEASQGFIQAVVVEYCMCNIDQLSWWGGGCKVCLLDVR
jgi:hypothetical protein